MSRAALLPSRDHVGGGGIVRAGLGGGGDCGGCEVVGEDAEAARCCRTSRMVEPRGGWEEESFVVLVGASSVVKILSVPVVLLWSSVGGSSEINSRRMREGIRWSLVEWNHGG